MVARSEQSHGERQSVDVLVLEDDAILRAQLANALRAEGLVVAETETCDATVRRVQEAPALVLVMDLNLPDGDALALLPTIKKLDRELCVYVITGYGSIDVAVRAVKSGAEDFLTKPVDVPKVVEVVRSSVQRRKRAQTGPRAQVGGPQLVALSDAMRRVEEQVARLQNSDSSVLVLGETGTGKSVLARRIHEIGRRATGPFVDVNCGGLSREFVESELFGHERGAFTGAHTAKAGLLDAAHQGTLFLDEIGDIDLQVQPKVLKVLEEKRFRRMGEVKERSVDVRLIAATHHDLLEAIERKTFRADLYYRISTVTITMPSLRQRVEDILPLARAILAGLSDAPVEIADDARDALLAYRWPGNIRELKNVLERALLACEDDTIRSQDLSFDGRSTERNIALPSVNENAPDSIKDLEREHIMRTLSQEGGRVEAAARRLDMPRSTLYQKLKNYGIQVSKIRRSTAGAVEITGVKTKP